MVESQIGELLRRHGLRLAVAESCTGGLIGHRITNIPGSSTYYMGSVTAYSYEAKVRLLGVRWKTLEKFGAVSEQTVKEMASGVRQALAADVGLSVSGIAGPGGGTTDKPVGLVCIGLSLPGEEKTWTLIMDSGDRIQNKVESAEKALELLLEELQGRADMLHTAIEPSHNPESHARTMEPIDLIARFDKEGRVQPLRFVWRGVNQEIESTGRRWSTEEGLFILVMTAEKKTFRLLEVRAEGKWYAAPASRMQPEGRA